MISVTLNFSEILAQKVPALESFRLLLDNIFSYKIAVKNVGKCSNVEASMSLNEGSASIHNKKNSKFSSISGIPFVLTYFKPQQYSLQINCNSQIMKDIRVCIKDNYTNTITPILLNSITNYSFTVENDILASRSANRFFLIFVSTAALFFNGLAISGDTTYKHVKLTFNTINECEMNNYGIENSAADTYSRNQKNELNILSLIVKLNLESS